MENVLLSVQCFHLESTGAHGFFQEEVRLKSAFLMRSETLLRKGRELYVRTLESWTCCSTTEERTVSVCFLRGAMSLNIYPSPVLERGT